MDELMKWRDIKCIVNIEPRQDGGEIVGRRGEDKSDDDWKNDEYWKCEGDSSACGRTIAIDEEYLSTPNGMLCVECARKIWTALEQEGHFVEMCSYCEFKPANEEELRIVYMLPEHGEEYGVRLCEQCYETCTWEGKS